MRLSVPTVVLGASVALGGLGLGVAALSSTACTASTAINTALVTDGLQISATELFLNYGCGNTSPDLPYKYLAVVIGSQRQIIAAGIFDCFADAVFANLPGADSGQLAFAVWVYVYNQADYAIANTSDALVNAVYGNGVTDFGLDGLIQPDASVLPLRANAVPDGGVTRVGLQRDLATVCESQATWVTECNAVSQAGVQVAASCNLPLMLVNKPASSCNLAIDLPEAGRD